MPLKQRLEEATGEFSARVAVPANTRPVIT
jgi:hypothetical protein